MNESASLQNLNDIVLSADVSWWPLAPGWFVLAAILLVAMVFFGIRLFRRHKNNLYRKQALRELSVIRTRADPATFYQIPSLLKRTALVVWPRQQVAAMTGTDWHRFLDQTAATQLFTSGAGEILDLLAYGGEDISAVNEQQLNTVMNASIFWLNHHRNKPLNG